MPAGPVETRRPFKLLPLLTVKPLAPVKDKSSQHGWEPETIN